MSLFFPAGILAAVCVGPVQTSDLLGVARWIYWPPDRWHEMQ